MRHLEAIREMFSPAPLGQLLIAFNGTFSQSNIVNLGENIRSQVSESSNTNVARRAFSIFIEMSQNVMRYSFERNRNDLGKGRFLLFLQNDSFHLIACNLIEPKQMDFLKQKISEVNRLSPEELKFSYLVGQRQKLNKESGSAGLGLLDMIRRSGKPLGIGFLTEGEGRLRFFIRAVV